MEVLMRMLRTSLVALLVVFPALAAADERHAVTPAALAAAVANHAAKQDADRAAIEQALSRPEVRDVAAKAGLDLTRVATAAQTLTGADLERAADVARQVNTSLVGGASTVVISTTTIIIALLVVILIVVAVD
jgi:hypothetical protein